MLIVHNASAVNEALQIWIDIGFLLDSLFELTYGNLKINDS